MCTRYTIASTAAAIEDELQAEFQYAFQKVYNAHFGMDLPVILAGEETKVTTCRWGLIPYWSKEANTKYHHINSDARNIVKNPLYRVPVRKRRCLVLANCFFIWVLNQQGVKQPFVVYDAKQRIMTFAGIWDVWKDNDSGHCITSFSMVTTHANKRLKQFSSKMPAIIPPSRRRKYLRVSTHLNEVIRMLRPLELESLNLYPVSPLVNNFSNNTKDVVMPVGQRIYTEYTYVPKIYLKLEGMGSMKDNPDRKPEIKLML